MERVRASVALACPQHEAEALLPRVFERYRGADGIIRFPLHVALEDFGVPLGLEIGREVEVRVTRRRDEQNLNEIYAITWQPAGGGPFPAFDGTLILWSEEHPAACYLELDGTYEPPLGHVVGAAFDATIGHLIAERTATQFLHDIAAAIGTLRASVRT